MNVLAGCDFFTVEVLTWRGPVTYYVLFFLHLESRRVSVAGITRHPDQEWMEQIARSATQNTWGYLHSCRYVLHDRDTKFCASFRSALASGGVKTIPLPARSPNLNAFAERCHNKNDRAPKGREKDGYTCHSTSDPRLPAKQPACRANNVRETRKGIHT
jgi:hypothetical protein